LPEGDTIYKAAQALRPLLVGQTIQAARARTPGPMIERVVGSRVEQITTSGKHLTIHFDNGLALHTHLRMGGSWHRYSPGERWRRPPSQARVVLEVPGHVVVLFNAPVAELVSERVLERHPALSSLGPDLLGPSFDLDEALTRLRACDLPIGEALLDQRVVAGIGNVYKSEVLFLERLDPWTPVTALEEARLRSVLLTAERLLRANVRAGAPRITTTNSNSDSGAEPSLRSPVWVYARAGRPCFRCRAPIQARRQGRDLPRLTYWCPTCQSPAASRPAPEWSRTAGR
jgi:endonuclease-8